ncbi:putative GTP-binding protein EngB [Iodidimonas gelatinilytica]|uniref:Probable GTP-binding protein EngB n=1 Tax=Iodidimonas gelatinilytica TaxID=1236966 RepID=A0A5A7MP06_9PROT|nr:ribosome biogenesis GTP-binding protein YihA/YsxC [Iodidimonas gelatinilytica]GEQ97720.1 putative GTP-binding protein EngB [Iodidimonas gelatinilytica]GER00984.1 putative GTP-binding protein EngB [Iodidimonas gelatinilytica]
MSTESPEHPPLPDISSAAIEQGRVLFAGPCTFLRGVPTMDHLPPPGLPEVAFAGRSNVGKSSLINALTGRNTLARTSNTPGRTQELNFFQLGDEAASFILVDLPGYGYAKVSRSKVQAWTGTIRDYLRGRQPLQRVMVLVDSRHGLKDNDREIMKMLDDAAVSYQIVLTKLDKLKTPAQARIHKEVTQEARRFVACHPRVHATSSEKGIGIEGLRAELAAFASPKA